MLGSSRHSFAALRTSLDARSGEAGFGTVASDLLAVDRSGGAITEAGVRLNVDVGLRYLEAWLSGTGAAAIHNLMEDAATAEISRGQLWQWVRHAVTTAEGSTVDASMVRTVIADGGQE